MIDLVLAAALSLFSWTPIELEGAVSQIELTPVEERAALKVQERAHWELVYAWPAAFSPDNTKLVMIAPEIIVTAADVPRDAEDAWRKIIVWNVADKTVLRQLTGHSDSIRQTAFSRDGKKVVGTVQKCVSIRRSDTEIIVWDAENGDVIKRFTVEGLSIGLSRSGDVLLTAFGRTGQVMAYDLANEGKRIFSTEIQRFKNCVLAPNGRLTAILATDNSVKIWDLATGKEKASFSLGHMPFPSMFFNDDGSILAVRSGLYTDCWSVAEKKISCRFAFAGTALSPNGKYLLGTRGDDIALVSLNSQKRVAELQFKGEKSRASSFLFSPNGASIIVAGDNKIRIWDLPKDLPQ